jgi:hypothetical protein
VYQQKHTICYFQHGLPDEEATARHWSGQRYNEDFAALGVSNPAVTDRDAAQIRMPYMLDSRYLHDEWHPIEVGNVQPHEPLQEILAGTPFEDWNRAAAIMRIAGDIHDVGYKNIDADPHGRGAWPAQIVRLINGVADWRVNVVDGERLYETFLTDKGRSADEALTQMVAYLFELPEDGALNHKTGGSNEFDSALAGVQFIKKHAIENKERPMAMVDVVAVAAIVAATIPFQPNASVDEHGRITEGFMERLGRRVHKTLLDIGYDPETAYRTTNAITAMGVCVANRDTGPLTRPDNAPGLIHGARLLKTEETVLDGRHALREPVTTMSGLTRMARICARRPACIKRLCAATYRQVVSPSLWFHSMTRAIYAAWSTRIHHKKYTPKPRHMSPKMSIYPTIFLRCHGVGITLGRCLLRKTGRTGLGSARRGGLQGDAAHNDAGRGPLYATFCHRR